VSQIGWDELLKSRSAVFVMEEEYRMQKAQVDIQQVEPDSEDLGRVVIHEDGTVVRKGEADDDASTRALVSPSHGRSASTAASTPPGPDVPTIVISTEADRESGSESREHESESETATIAVNGDVSEDDKGSDVGLNHAESLERPVQSAVRDGDSEPSNPGAGAAPDSFSFSNKRLCERWLDNLFMVLYEVRVNPLGALPLFFC
jgi:hypothetical protein